MEQNIQPQQFISPTPLSDEDKIKLFGNFLKRHKIISIILGLFLICIFSILFYFLIILSVKISKTDDNKYSALLKNNNYQVVITDPQYVYPYYSIVENEFGNKIVLIRNDTPKSMQDFLIVRGAYQFYFSNIRNNLVREIISDIPGFIRHPFGFGKLLIAKFSNNQYGYSENKKNEAQEKALAENQSQLTDVNLVGEIVELIDKLNAFRVVLLDPKTFNVIVANNNQKQAIVYYGKTQKNNNEAKLFDQGGRPVEVSYFNVQGIADGKYVIKIAGQKEPNEQDYTIVYAQEIRQTPWMTRYINKEFGISLLYPSYWGPGDSYPYVQAKYADKSSVKTVKLGENSSRQDITGGFFSVNIIESFGDDLSKVAHSYANVNGIKSGDYYPYGLKPEFRETKVVGQNAMLIIPSSDQAGEFYPKGTRAAIIQYPTPLKLEEQCREWDCAPGQTTYTKTFEYIIISADKDNFQTILDSVEFVR